MDHILEKLVAADSEAKAIVEEAEEFLEATVGGMEREVELYKEAYTQRATHRIGIIRDEEGKSSRQATEDISSRYEQLMEGLERAYEENHIRWEDELYNKCIGR